MSSAARFPRFITVGFVGARKLDDSPEPAAAAEREKLLRVRLGEVLDQIEGRADPKEYVVAISSLAAGGDTIFAEVVAERRLPHQVFLPQTADLFFSPKDFETPERLNRSQRGLAAGNVIEIRVVSDSPDRRVRFSECGFEIANACDVLIAVHAPLAPPRPGGTIETLEFARTLGKRIFEIQLGPEMAVGETPAKPAAPSDPPDLNVERLFAVGPRESWDPQAYLPAVAALKERASFISRRSKVYFQYAAAFVVSTHVLATVIAGAALAFGYHQFWLIWAKALLLVTGLSIPFYLHWRTPQRAWATGRLVAEMCRSVLALRGYPGRLTYFEALHLPELDWLMQSLDVLHQEAVAANPIPLRDFAAAYEGARLGVQIEFYAARVRQAKKIRFVLEGLFYAFSIAALIGVIEYGWILAGHPGRPGMKEFAEFVPIAFPVAAVACAAWISTLDLDRAIERFSAMGIFLTQERDCLRAADSKVIVVRSIDRIERALLHEVVEWYAKHAFVRGH